MRVTVTKEHYDRSRLETVIGPRSSTCPIAVALRERHPLALVTGVQIVLRDGKSANRYYVIPRRVRKMIEAFDEDITASRSPVPLPFSFIARKERP